MEDFLEAFFIVIGVLFLAILINLFYAWIGCWLWGIVMVNVFGAPALTYWQTYALIWLIHILMPTSYRTSTGKD